MPRARPVPITYQFVPVILSRPRSHILCVTPEFAPFCILELDMREKIDEKQLTLPVYESRPPKWLPKIHGDADLGE